MSVHNYSLFGLRVRSSIAFPELLSASDDTEADVTIGAGPVPEAEGARPGLSAIDGVLLLVVPKVGRYRIAEGRSVTVEVEPGVPERNVRLFLLGSAFGALLHQRGLLPLHANAVAIEGKAVAFMGASGAGKSTLAAWFHDRGFPVLSDDVCVVEFSENGRPLVRPGVGRLRLSHEVLSATGRDAADYERSFIGDDAPDKYDVPLTQGPAALTSSPLAAIYLLDRGRETLIEPIDGVDAIEAAFANTYRGGFVAKSGTSREHWSASLKIIRSTPMFRLLRRWGLDQLDAQCALLLDHAEEVLFQGWTPVGDKTG